MKKRVSKRYKKLLDLSKDKKIINVEEAIVKIIPESSVVIAR